MSQQGPNQEPGKEQVHVLRRDVVCTSVAPGNNVLSVNVAEAFKVFVESRGLDFLQEIDTWLANHEGENRQDTSKRKIRLGVGVYLIHDEIPKD